MSYKSDVGGNVPKLRFPEFRTLPGWEEKQLRRLFSERKETGYVSLPLLSLTDKEGIVPQSESNRKSTANQDKSKYLRVCPGDIAYNTMRMWEGRSALVPVEGVVSPAYTVCHPKDGVDGKFFSFYFKTKPLINLFRKFSQGLVNDTLNLKFPEFSKILIFIPTTKEQQKIADCLYSIDELIDSQTQKLDALKAHKIGLMQQLFPAEGETAPKLRFPEFRDAPEWEEKLLGQIAKYENGKAHEKNISDSGKYVVVNSKFISTDGEIRKYSDEAFCIADAGDVLMVLSDVPNGRAIAKCYFVVSNDLYTVNQRICKIKPRKIDGKFLYYILDRNQYFLSFDDGVKQTNLRKDDVLNCPMYLPPLLEEQKKISALISSIDELIAAQAKKIENLTAHKKGLMQQLFPTADGAHG